MSPSRKGCSREHIARLIQKYRIGGRHYTRPLWSDAGRSLALLGCGDGELLPLVECRARGLEAVPNEECRLAICRKYPGKINNFFP
jgi:hypothetical protein